MSELNSVLFDDGFDTIKAYTRIPYAIITQEIGSLAQDFLSEMKQICEYYEIYKKGVKFTVEGTNGDYVPAKLRYKMTSSLINKEARFLFAEPPDIVIETKGDISVASDESKDMVTAMNEMLKAILDENKFEDALLKGARDCFIGKRIAILVNFNEEDGVTLTFLPSTQFFYETKLNNPNVITKFFAFTVLNENSMLKDKRIFKKKYEMDNNGNVYLTEEIFDGIGNNIATLRDKQKTLMPMIPAIICANDGLTGELLGESEIELLKDYEQWYSKLSNADIDAERKSMNPIRYTVDMDSSSTSNLSSSAGSYWDLGSDQNLEFAKPSVGMLESSMSYSESLKTSLDRLKTTGYEQIDMPNITLESLQGAITSGKALKAIYWPLVVRCKEKMKMWGPQLRKLVDIIIQGAIKYPNCISKYTNHIISPVAYEIKVTQNLPLPEDEIEEKSMDLQEVQMQVMSRKKYMQKWRSLSDAEVDEELKQIAIERQMLEDSVTLPPIDISDFD